MSHKPINGSLYKRNQPSKQGEGSWAVSYADFLMVLLSFFIIFFSMDKKTLLHSISADLHKFAAANGKGNNSGSAKGPYAGSGQGTGLGSSISDDQGIIRKIASSIVGAKPILAKSPDKVILDLPADIYAVGEYELDPNLLNPIIEQLRPYAEHVNIIVVGHADSISFAEKKKNIMRDNMTLSSVRASFASIYLRAKLPQTVIWTQGMSENKRNTRSLSLVVELKNKENQI
jgi:flagellar motor protein MotB